MGSKYSTNVTSGYNTSPPADDGSATEANRIKWSTIKSKLADPDKTRNDLVNTDLVEHFDQGPDAKSGAYTTLATDYNTVLECTGTITISLGDAATMAAGYFVTVVNAGAGTVTVDLDTGADTLNGDEAGSTTLSPDNSLSFMVNSSADGYYTASSGLATLGALTATLAEVNVLDVSANAVSNHVGPGISTYFYNGSSDRATFDVDANVADATWESIGPTGSGADNVWTGMDSIPAGAIAVILGCNVAAIASGSVDVSVALYARPGNVAWGVAGDTLINLATKESAVIGDTAQAFVYAVIPLDTSDLTFDTHYVGESESSLTISYTYMGFMI